MTFYLSIWDHKTIIHIRSITWYPWSFWADCIVARCLQTSFGREKKCCLVISLSGKQGPLFRNDKNNEVVHRMSWKKLSEVEEDKSKLIRGQNMKLCRYKYEACIRSGNTKVRAKAENYDSTLWHSPQSPHPGLVMIKFVSKVRGQLFNSCI